MAVAIPFTADFTEVRAAMDRLIADARATKISLGGGSFGAGLGGGNGGGNAPTVQGIFGGTPGGVSGNFGAGVGAGFGGPGSPLANSGFFSTGPTGMSVFGYPGSASTAMGSGAVAVTSPQGANVIVAQAAGGGSRGSSAPNVSGVFGGSGQGGNSFSGNPFLTRGFGRLVGAGYLLRTLEGAAESEQAYSIQSALGGSDQRQQLAAQLGLRKSLTGSVPLVGNLVDLLNDPGGQGQIGVQATIKAADAQEQRTELRQQFARRSERLTDAAALAGVEDQGEASKLRSASVNQDNLRDIREKSAAIYRKDLERIASESTARESSFQSRQATNEAQQYRLGRVDPEGLGFRSELERADAKARADSITGASEANKKRIADETTKENLRFSRETEVQRLKEGRANFLETNSLKGTESVFRAIAGGDAEGASRLSVENEVHQANLRAFETPGVSKGLLDATRSAGAARLDADARERAERKLNQDNAINARGRIAQVRGQDDVDVERIGNQSASAALSGSPLTAAIIANRAKRLDALNKIDRFQNSDLYNATNERFDIVEAQLTKDDTQSHRRALAAETARGRILDIELKGGPYSHAEAAAASIKEAALLKVNDLINEGAAGNKNLIARTFQNAEKEENIVAKNFLQRFKPEEFNINRTASQSLNNDEATETLKSIDENIKAIKESSQNWGKAQ